MKSIDKSQLIFCALCCVISRTNSLTSQNLFSSVTSIQLIFEYSTSLTDIRRQKALLLRTVSPIIENNFYFYETTRINSTTLLIKNITCLPSNHLTTCENATPYFLVIRNSFVPEIDYQYQFDIKASNNQESFRDIWQNRENILKNNFFCSFNHGQTITPSVIYDPSKPPRSNTIAIIFLSICVIATLLFGCAWSSYSHWKRFRCYQAEEHRRKQLANLIEKVLNRSPVITYDANNENVDQENGKDPMCAICLENYQNGDKIRLLICSHRFHLNCIDPWLKERQVCPLCNRNIFRNSIQSISSSIVNDLMYRPSESVTERPSNVLSVYH